MMRKGMKTAGSWGIPSHSNFEKELLRHYELRILDELAKAKFGMIKQEPVIWESWLRQLKMFTVLGLESKVNSVPTVIYHHPCINCFVFIDPIIKLDK
jgi:hypothetical protein